jgi:hypothetical protein
MRKCKFVRLADSENWAGLRGVNGDINPNVNRQKKQN